MLDMALLIVTLTAAGEPRMSLTDTTSLQACEQSRATILGVLKQRQVEVLEARCAVNSLALTPYAHGAVDADYQHHYRVTLFTGKEPTGKELIGKQLASDKPAADKPMEEGYQLEYLTPGKACDAKTSTDNTVLCVVASQQPLP